MNTRICCDECIENEDGIFFPWYDRNGLCFLAKDSSKVRLVKVFDKYSLYLKRLFKAVQCVGDKIFLGACMADQIIIFDYKTSNMVSLDIEKLPLKANRGYKFWSSIIHERTIYFIGHYYPAILKVDVNTYAIEYITEWVEELNAVSKNDEPYFTGGIVVGDYAYIPSCCTNVVLKLGLRSGETNIIYLDTDVFGFNGIQCVDDKFWLIARNSDTLLKWDENTGSVRKIVINDKGSKEYLGFYEPLIYKKKILLAPILASHFYCYDIENEKLEVIDDLEYIFNIVPFEDCMSADIVLAPRVRGAELCFVSGRDYKWHVWNIDNGKENVYEVFADVEMERHIENLPYSNLWNKYKNIDNLMVERNSFTCEEYAKYIVRKSR